MPRQRSSEPRDRQLLIRLTAEQSDVLEAIAFLHEQTPGAFAYGALAEHLRVEASDPAVQKVLATRAEFREHSAQTANLDRARTTRARADARDAAAKRGEGGA